MGVTDVAGSYHDGRTGVQLDRSVNAALIRAGLAYGEFYTTMPFH